MLKVSVRSFLTLAAVAVLLIAPNVTAQVPQAIDMYTSISASATSAAPGETIDFTVTYGNNGPTAPTVGVFHVDLPPGYPVTDENFDAFEASVGGTFTPVDGSAGVFTDFDCTGVMVLVFGPDQEAGFFDAGNEQQVTFSMVMPELPMVAANLAIDGYSDSVLIDPAGGHFQDGIDCSDDQTWMGPRLIDVPAITAEIQVVDDGSGADGNQGCGELVGFTPGNIAWIDRGSCSFDVKVVNAQIAGASAAVIGNNIEDTNYAPDAPIGMGCSDYCGLLTIPSVGVSANVNEEVMALVAAGTVTGTIGAAETDHLTVFATVYENGDGVDSDPTNDDSYFEFTVTDGGTTTAPTAAFTYAPTTVYVGDVVTFTDASTGDPMPDTFAWDFGDTVGTSTEQNPTYTYTAAGTYTVMLTATNSVGSDDFSMDVVVMPDGGGVVFDELYYVPAAAKAEGDEGAFFVTDLVINNTGDAMATIKFLWLPRQDDNSTPGESAEYTLDAGVSATYADVLGAAFGVETGAVGALAVASDSADLLLMSRTYNLVADDATCFPGATFGQSIPGYHSTGLIMANDMQRILFLVENDAFRSNLGLMNGTGANIRIMWTRYAADGTAIDDGFKDLGPWGNTQLNRVLADVAPVVGAYVDVWTETVDGAFAAYGSVVDNTTSDPTTVLPQ